MHRQMQKKKEYIICLLLWEFNSLTSYVIIVDAGTNMQSKSKNRKKTHADNLFCDCLNIRINDSLEPCLA